jgi:hypothetical protein
VAHRLRRAAARRRPDRRHDDGRGGTRREALRLARPCDVDVAFAQVEPEIAPASLGGEATLRLSLVAGAPAISGSGLRAARGGRSGRERRDAREIETAPLESRSNSKGGRHGARLGEWRPPRMVETGAPAWKVALLVGATLARSWRSAGSRAAAGAREPRRREPTPRSPSTGGASSRVSKPFPDAVERGAAGGGISRNRA